MSIKSAVSWEFAFAPAAPEAVRTWTGVGEGGGLGGAKGGGRMISAVRAAPKSGFHGVRLGCGDIHALKRCFILTISLSLYTLAQSLVPIEWIKRNHLKSDNSI